MTARILLGIDIPRGSWCKTWSFMIWEYFFFGILAFWQDLFCYVFGYDSNTTNKIPYDLTPLV